MCVDSWCLYTRSSLLVRPSCRNHSTHSPRRIATHSTHKPTTVSHTAHPWLYTVITTHTSNTQMHPRRTTTHNSLCHIGTLHTHTRGHSGTQPLSHVPQTCLIPHITSTTLLLMLDTSYGHKALNIITKGSPHSHKASQSSHKGSQLSHKALSHKGNTTQPRRLPI